MWAGLTKLVVGSTAFGVAGLAGLGKLKGESLETSAAIHEDILRRRLPSFDAHSVSWQYGDLSFHSSKERPISKPRAGDSPCAVLYVAPPSFVSSRSIFIDLAQESEKDEGHFAYRLPFALTEAPGYGTNTNKIPSEQLRPHTFVSGIRAMIQDLSRRHGGGPVAVVASGHSALYCAEIAAIHQENNKLVSHVALLNPTSVGPLPSAMATAEMKGNKVVSSIIGGVASSIWSCYQLPLGIGAGLHLVLNTEGNIMNQLKSHVFVDFKRSITVDVIKQNTQMAHQGPRQPKCAFLVGKSDYCLPSHKDTPATDEQIIDLLAKAKDKGVKLGIVMGDSSPALQQRLAKAWATGADIPYKETRGALRSFQEFAKASSDAVKEALTGTS